MKCESDTEAMSIDQANRQLVFRRFNNSFSKSFETTGSNEIGRYEVTSFDVAS